MAYEVKLPPIRPDGENLTGVPPMPGKPVTAVTPVTYGPGVTAEQGRDQPKIPEPSASASVTDPERLATLDAEEALFRTYWKTIPDKTLARRTWPSELRYYCRVKRLGVEVAEDLEKRCRDLDAEGG